MWASIPRKYIRWSGTAISLTVGMNAPSNYQIVDEGGLEPGMDPTIRY